MTAEQPSQNGRGVIATESQRKPSALELRCWHQAEGQPALPYARCVADGNLSLGCLLLFFCPRVLAAVHSIRRVETANLLVASPLCPNHRTHMFFRAHRWEHSTTDRNNSESSVYGKHQPPHEGRGSTYGTRPAAQPEGTAVLLCRLVLCRLVLCALCEGYVPFCETAEKGGNTHRHTHTSGMRRTRYATSDGHQRSGRARTSDRPKRQAK